MVKEKLLGFDARENWMDYPVQWDDARKTSFLLRPDMTKPHSTDIYVWPTVFDRGPGLVFFDPDCLKAGFKSVTPPDWTGPNYWLWENLERRPSDG